MKFILSALCCYINKPSAGDLHFNLIDKNVKSDSLTPSGRVLQQFLLLVGSQAFARDVKRNSRKRFARKFENLW